MILCSTRMLLTALINEAGRTLAGSHCIVFEFWVAFTLDRLLWMCFFSLVECTASNYSFVELFWRWNCYELSCGNIHLAVVDGYVGATVEVWVKEFIRWLYAASYRDHQLRYEFFFQSIPKIVSFKREILSEIRESYTVCTLFLQQTTR